jgi:hypothetical protein
MNVLVKILEALGYATITVDGDKVRSVMMVRKVGGRDSLLPPSIILTRIEGTSFIDVKIYFDIKDDLDTPLVPLTVQSFGLNHHQDGQYSVIFYRLFEAGFNEKYIKHVLNNLGSCLITLIEQTAPKS